MTAAAAISHDIATMAPRSGERRARGASGVRWLAYLLAEEPSALTADSADIDADGRPYRRLLVSEESAGTRADKWLSLRFSSLSRTVAARHLKAGLVVSEWRPLKGSTPLQPGEPLRVFIPGFAPEGAPPPLPPVLLEDERVLVIDKPPGLLAHPAGDRFTWAVIGLAKQARPDARVDLVHRLDRDTSGVMVLTKDVEANAILKERFKTRARDLRKVYLAIVRGLVPWDERVVDAPIGPHPASTVRLRRAVTPDGLPSRTTFTVLQRVASSELSLVQCALHTGRTHQIRVHLEHVGHPLVGDRLYGHPDAVFLDWLDEGASASVRARVGFPRQCLHAWRLRLPHPDGGTVDLEAPLPADMQALLDGAPPRWEEDP